MARIKSTASPAPIDPRARLDLFKTLGDNTRYAIYLELARSNRPLTTSDIAETLDLHPNTVRPHLDRMRDVGLVEMTVTARGEVGRPQHRYRLAGDAPSLGLEPSVVRSLAQMVLSLADRMGARHDDAVAVGEDEGARRAAVYRDAPSSIEALVADLDRLGFDPVVVDDPVDPDVAIVAFSNCPFGDVAGEHPDLVCGLHRGIVGGFLDAMGEASPLDFSGLVDREPCRVTVALDPHAGRGREAPVAWVT